MKNLTFALLSNHGTEAGQQAIKTIAKTCREYAPSVGYISSAVDHDRYFYQYTQAMYQRVGLNVAEYIDFEAHFSEALLNKVLSHPIVHLSGGNTFQFLQGVQRRGVLSRLIDYVQSGGKFVGLSAGALLLTPDISVSSLVGDEAIFPVENTQGLGLLPWLFLPHVQPEQHRFLAQQSLKTSFPIILCDDHSAVVVLNGSIKIIGNPQVAQQGKITKLAELI